MSSTPSTSGFITSLQLTQKYLYRFFGPIFVAFGIVNCILSLMVFARKNLRKSTCSIYFIAYNISNFQFIIFSLLSLTLEIGYNIDPALNYLSYCRFRLYMAYLFNGLSPLYLLFASIDRVLITSHNVQMRQKSTHRLAYTVTGSNALMWTLIQIHVVFFVNILQIEPNYLYCYIDPGWYSEIISYFALGKVIVIPLSLAIFGFWSLRNIRNIHRARVSNVVLPNNRSIATNPFSVRSRDRQLVLMLLTDIVIYILFNLMMTVSLLYEQSIYYQETTVEQKKIVIFIRNIANFSLHIPFCVNCYTHLLVSKTFRNEVKNISLWRRLLRFYHRN